MSKFVVIQSEITVRVTGRLDHINHTKVNSDIPNRMKISENWSMVNIKIEKGRHTYPAVITTWPTVKALENDKIITIGKEIEDTDKEVTDADRAKAVKLAEGLALQKFNKEQNAKVKADIAKAEKEEKVEEAKAKKATEIKDINLEEIAGE